MIVDASVAVKWVIEEADSPLARELLGRTDLIAPALIHSEVANAIWKKQRRGEFANEADLLQLPSMLASLIVTVDDTPMMPRALKLAIELDHPIYDCVYLATAELLDRALMTADARFLRKASSHASGSRVLALT